MKQEEKNTHQRHDTKYPNTSNNNEQSIGTPGGTNTMTWRHRKEGEKYSKKGRIISIQKLTKVKNGFWWFLATDFNAVNVSGLM